MKTGIPFLLAASIGFAAAALAQPAGKPPQVIDINGVRIGMSPAEATAAIGATGMPNIHRGGRDFFIDKRSEEHTSELQSLMRISYAVFCLKKTKQYINTKKSTT